MPVLRKLVAVVVADVAGYSRLMEHDEAGTHQRLRALHDALVAPKIAENGGRIVKTAGDGMLLEFASATSALRWAVEVQRAMRARNQDIAAGHRIEFRIGINLGDIIVDGDDIIGDGVNVAARLEALAEPGGICVAASVWEQVREDLGIQFVDAGEQQVKNISKPIHIYRVVLERSSASDQDTGVATNWRPPFSGRAVAGLGMLGLVGLAVAVYWFTINSRPPHDSAAEAIPLRSVLVIPFSVSEDDPALTAAAPRLSRDVTQALADTLRNVRVVSAAEAEAHKDKISDVRTLGRDANVRFLVETDLRRSGSTEIAITLRIIDTRDGKQIENARRTADRAEFADVDKTVLFVTMMARAAVTKAIWRDVMSRGDAATSAADFVDRANTVSIPDPAANAREMRRLADAAVKADPNFTHAWTTRVDATIRLFYTDFSADPEALLADADADSLRAVALDTQDAVAWLARAQALRIRGNQAAAFDAVDRAERLDRTRMFGLLVRGWVYLDAGKPDDTMKLVAEVRDVGGRDSIAGLLACAAQVMRGAYDEAITECERLQMSWDIWYRDANLTASYAMRGDAEKAARAKARLLKSVPGFTIARYQARFYPTVSPEGAALDKTHLVAGLRKAGVPE
jgi:class 3 adenylate cyclase/TolB-like protein/tetratricopeptide (TPR) repeat protein